MAESNDRKNRELETREAGERPQPWDVNSSLLPDPKPRPGIRYRWVRTQIMGQPDPLNVSRRFREGWDPVRAEDYPELRLLRDRDSRFPEGVEVGGLLLCATSEEYVKARNERNRKQGEQQERAIASQLLANEDARMPMFRQQKSTTRFGPDARREANTLDK
jgi:hypothetical protein